MQLVVLKHTFLIPNYWSSQMVASTESSATTTLYFQGNERLRLRTCCVLTILSSLHCLQSAENCTNCSNYQTVSTFEFNLCIQQPYYQAFLRAQGRGDFQPIGRKKDLIRMYRGALVSGFVNVLVYFNKLACNF